MQNLLSLLLYLACPIGMGLMMWFMIRDNKAQTMSSLPPSARERQEGKAQDVIPIDSLVTLATRSARLAAMRGLKFGAICMEPRVAAGFAIIGVGVLMLANVAINLLFYYFSLVLLFSAERDDPSSDRIPAKT